MLSESDSDFLSHTCGFYERLSVAERESLLATSKAITYEKGSVLHSGDGDCLGAIVVKTGELRIALVSPQGREVTLTRLFPDDVCMLAASCIFDAISFEVFISAEKDTDVVVFEVANFKRLIAENVYVEAFSYRQMAEKFSEVVWMIEQVFFMSFDQRLATFLLDECAKTGADIIDLSHDKIASYMGASREAVSRMMKFFEREGLVSLRYKHVELTDKPGLRALIG
ncbi:MAG: Crp/Fnr family transcriptional regulator [Raoultibacter sp.]